MAKSNLTVSVPMTLQVEVLALAEKYNTTPRALYNFFIRNACRSNQNLEFETSGYRNTVAINLSLEADTTKLLAAKLEEFPTLSRSRALSRMFCKQFQDLIIYLSNPENNLNGLV